MEAAAAEARARNERNRLMLKASALGLLPDVQRLVETLGADATCEVRVRERADGKPAAGSAHTRPWRRPTHGHLHSPNRGAGGEGARDACAAAAPSVAQDKDRAQPAHFAAAGGHVAVDRVNDPRRAADAKPERQTYKGKSIG